LHFIKVKHSASELVEVKEGEDAESLRCNSVLTVCQKMRIQKGDKRGSMKTKVLGDRSPPTISRGRAPVRVWDDAPRTQSRADCWIFDWTKYIKIQHNKNYR